MLSGCRILDAEIWCSYIKFLCGLTHCFPPHTLPPIVLGNSALYREVLQWLVTGWTVRGSNSGGCEIFRTRPDRPWCPANLLYSEYRVFPRGKGAGTWRWPPAQSSAEVKERVELFLFSPSGPSWPVLGWTVFRTSAQRLYWDLDQSSHTNAPYRLNFANDTLSFPPIPVH